MRKTTTALISVLALVMVAVLPAEAGGSKFQGSFIARALPFPAMQADIYYPQKGSCLDGIDGIHRVSESFHALDAGTLSIYIEDLSGDWDLYALGAQDGQLGTSDKAQVLEGDDGRERVTVTVQRHQRVQMVACNWLGEPEVTVKFEFVPKESRTRSP